MFVIISPWLASTGSVALNFCEVSQVTSCTISMFSHWVTFIPSRAVFYNRSGVYTVIGVSCELRNSPYFSPGLQHNTSLLRQHGRICFLPAQTKFYSTFQRQGRCFPLAAYYNCSVLMALCSHKGFFISALIEMISRLSWFLEFKKKTILMNFITLNWSNPLTWSLDLIVRVILYQIFLLYHNPANFKIFLYSENFYTLHSFNSSSLCDIKRLRFL